MLQHGFGQKTTFFVQISACQASFKTDLRVELESFKHYKQILSYETVMPSY